MTCTDHVVLLQVVVEALLQDKAFRDAVQSQQPDRVPFQTRMWARIRALAMVAILYLIVLPISLVGLAIATFVEMSSEKSPHAKPAPPGSRGTVLVSGM